MSELQKFSVHQFYEKLDKNHVIMIFQGVMSQQVLSLIAKNLRGASDNEVVGRRLFGIVIELAQNIHHYSTETGKTEFDSNEIGIGTIVVSENKNHHVITSGNMIKREDGQDILKRCDYINGLSKSELRSYYVDQRREPQRADKFGANLGFIDMARRAGRPLKAEIIEIDDQKSFFIVSVSVQKNIHK